MPKKSFLAQAAQKYKELAAAYPEEKLALDLAPITGQVMSGLDAGAAAVEGRYGDAMLEGLGMIPGIKYIPGMGLTKAVTKYASNPAKLGRLADQVSDGLSYAEQKKENAGYKNGGKVTSKKTTKPRGIGIAKRGWGKAGVK